ncbi:nucleoporin complex subunit 54-domain-containing protein [Mycena metata]|uniref:Nucleoporin complex subunit 54-domain-containing protein n=1 Tax=Mycena metata TaxID=1033252 RepID=A0AAD7KEI6_9AGAR|nr:nucleoporin complex subunit 54-domain-containing protein [Mycena metata]
MSLFGQPQQQQQGSNIFGAANNAPQQQQPSGGLFGASQNPAPSLFGQPNASQQQTPSLFGATNTATNTGGGLFGASNNQAPSGGLFGGQQQQQQQAQQPTGGLFGNNNQQPASGGLFGNSQQPQQQQQQQQGGGLFGNNNNNAGGGLFGTRPLAGAPTLPALSTNTTGGSLFGGGSLGQQPTQPSSFFSQPAQNQNQQQQRPGCLVRQARAIYLVPLPTTIMLRNLLSAVRSGKGLGQSQQQQQNPLSTSMLSTSSLRPPATGAGGPAQQQADAQTQFTRLTARIEGITAAWDARSPQCQFQYFFYNRVDPNQVGLYGRPPNATNDALWAKAARENPDPTCLVPAIAVGFDDLRQRVDAQGQQAAAHQERLKDLKTRLDTLSSTQTQNTARLARLAATQTQLMHRLLALAAHLHLLVPALRSSGLRAEEEALRGWLEEVKAEVGVRGGSGSGGGGRMRAKLGELWALVGALGAAREAAGGGNAHAPGGEDGLARIAQILSEQQAGLVHLTKILKGDLADINLVLKGGRAEEGDAEELWGSRQGR